MERTFGFVRRLFSRESLSAPSAGINSPPKVLFNCLPNNIHVAVSTSSTSSSPYAPASNRLLFKLSSGTVGLKGAAKTAPKAIPILLDALKERLTPYLGAAGASSGVRVAFRGVNTARPMLVSGLRRMGLRILEVADATGVPFNGCRPKKTRRL
jgi:small subunit ribosomal protein S11